MSENSYIRLPPDSTGKKLQTLQHTVGAEVVHSQTFHLADPTNPTNIQHIDERGQASIRLAEGSPGLDAFGNLRVSSATVLGAYEFTNGGMDDLFTDETLVGGTLVHDSTRSEVHLGVSDASGSSASRTANRYHYYQPGVGNLVVMTLALSDSGKVNNYREWGYADERNGLLFRLDGSTFKVVVRSDTSGSVVETTFSQSQFNGDKLDGTGLSGMTLDLTKANFYWIDFAWLGVGPVRFGVLAPDGSRVVCHTVNNPNNNLGAYMATGSLPLHFHNANTSITSGPSTLKLICSAIYAEASVDYTYWRYGDADTGLSPKTVTTDTLLLGFRPRYEVNGKVNRIGLYPEYLSVFVKGGTIRLQIIDDPVFTGGTWNDIGTAAQINTTATISGLPAAFHTFYLNEGIHRIDLSTIYETNDEGYHTLANALASGDCYSMALVGSVVDGTTVTCAATLNYKELR